MTIVLAASLALSWHFEDESTPEADRLLDPVTEDCALVPAIWRLEVANGLQVACVVLTFLRRRNVYGAAIAEPSKPVKPMVNAVAHSVSFVMFIAFLLSG